MALKDRISFLTTPAEVDAFLGANRSSAIFKAGTCHKTNETFKHVEEQLGPREDLPLELVVRNIEEDEALLRRYALEIPVLVLGDAEVARHRISEAELRSRLSELGL